MRQHSHVYDLFSIALHWLVAITVIALFASGIWMVDLGYYDDWYYRAPWWHIGIGIITFTLVVIRAIWSHFRPQVVKQVSLPQWQYTIAWLFHRLMNVAIIVLAVTGYFIVTAKGDALSFFDVLSVPVLTTLSSDAHSIMGNLHRWSGYFLIGLAIVHASAALKHHFIDKDLILKSMLAIKSGVKK